MTLKTALSTRFATSIILKLAYGYSVEPDGNDPLVDLAEEMMEDVLFPACISGTWMVDILPFRSSNINQEYRDLIKSIYPDYSALLP